jgi:hypothetical protein
MGWVLMSSLPYMKHTHWILGEHNKNKHFEFFFEKLNSHRSGHYILQNAHPLQRKNLEQEGLQIHYKRVRYQQIISIFP